MDREAKERKGSGFYVRSPVVERGQSRVEVCDGILVVRYLRHLLSTANSAALNEWNRPLASTKAQPNPRPNWKGKKRSKEASGLAKDCRSSKRCRNSLLRYNAQRCTKMNELRNFIWQFIWSSPEHVNAIPLSCVETIPFILIKEREDI